MYFVRHSERLDHVDPEKWENLKRYKQNKNDSPLSENGFKIAHKSIIEILKNDKRDIGYIFSSPAQRCIETALEFQKEIQRDKGILIPIKIENGLIYNKWCVNFPVFKKVESNRIIWGNKNLIYHINHILK
jgi:broad specificity phosphatase PhoE